MRTSVILVVSHASRVAVAQAAAAADVDATGTQSGWQLIPYMRYSQVTRNLFGSSVLRATHRIAVDTVYFVCLPHGHIVTLTFFGQTTSSTQNNITLHDCAVGSEVGGEFRHL